MDIQLRRPNAERWTGFAEADVFDAGLFLEGPIDDKSSIAFAMRRSYIDAILNVAIPDDAPVTLSTAPRYYDAQVLYSTKRDGHLVNVLAYGSATGWSLCWAQQACRPRARPAQAALSGPVADSMEYPGGAALRMTSTSGIWSRHRKCPSETLSISTFSSIRSSSEIG